MLKHTLPCPKQLSAMSETLSTSFRTLPLHSELPAVRINTAPRCHRCDHRVQQQGPQAAAACAVIWIPFGAAFAGGGRGGVAGPTSATISWMERVPMMANVSSPHGSVTDLQNKQHHQYLQHGRLASKATTTSRPAAAAVICS